MIKLQKAIVILKKILVFKKWGFLGFFQRLGMFLSEFLKWGIIISIFFQGVAVLVLLYGCTTWTNETHLEKKLDGNYTRMLHDILNKSWKKHPTKQQLSGHLLPISQTIQVRWTRHAGHYWRNENEFISNVLLWTPTQGHIGVSWPVKTYIHQLCVDTGCRLENFSAISYRDR